MTGALRRAVFLDRDGTLNRAVIRDGKPYPPSTLAELEVFPDAPAALAALKAADFLLIVVTNQPDVARRIRSREEIEVLNAALRAMLPLDDIFTCYHDDPDHCGCRKPLPGLLVQAAAKHGIDLGASFMVGDLWRDVEAGRRAGCRTVFVDRGYPDAAPPGRPDHTVQSLAAAAEWILGETEGTTDERR